MSKKYDKIINTDGSIECIATLTKGVKTFIGKSTCHADDAKHFCEYTGYDIASERAFQQYCDYQINRCKTFCTILCQVISDCYSYAKWDYMSDCDTIIQKRKKIAEERLAEWYRLKEQSQNREKSLLQGLVRFRYVIEKKNAGRIF